MPRTLLSAVLFALIGFASLATAAAAQDTLDCDDFLSRDAAQNALDANPDDPHGLDGRPGAGNGDGVACENEGSEDGATEDDGDTTELPVTGTGPVASSSKTMVVMLLSGALCLAAVATHLRFRVRR